MVLGFLFSPDCKEVILIRKKRPKWQAGYLNGVGGRVEVGETPLHAMRREFREETGIDIETWQRAMQFTCKGGTVFVYKAITQENDTLWQAESRTDETVDIFSVTDIHGKRVLDNIRWMVPMLLDNIEFPINFSYDSTGGCSQEAS
ncbi:NUDIX domain-containing protein [Candidatus Pacearchaeota archaeon]|nr:NUDIX domain-containing protein [Candidatus Pacearchaeota archaeon]